MVMITKSLNSANNAMRNIRIVKMHKELKIFIVPLLILASASIALAPISIHATSPPTVEFQFDMYDYNDPPAIITVTHAADNVDPTARDTIMVTVTSTTDPVGILLQLLETTDTSGIFQNTALVFMDDNNLFSVGSTITVNYDDPNFNFDPTSQDMVNLQIRSTTDLVGLDPFTLTETDADTSQFEGQITFSSDPTSGSSLQASPGDIINAFFPCETSNGLITPNPDPTVGAIRAAVDDTVTVSYMGSSDSITIFSEGGCGGGGGGLVISTVVLATGGGGKDGDLSPPSLTLNRFSAVVLSLPQEILATIMEADPFKPLMPIKDTALDLPLQINDEGFAISQYANTIQTYNAETGEPLKLRLILNDETGVEHIGLYTNLRGHEREVHNSDTFIVFDEHRPLEISDPNGHFSKVDFTVEEEGQRYVAVYEITFAKPMDTSDIIFRIWDERKNSGDTKIFNALKVTGTPLVDETVEIEKSNMLIPSLPVTKFYIPIADSSGNLVYHNPFGELEQKRTNPYHEPFYYPSDIGKAERHDDGFNKAVLLEKIKAEIIMKSLIINPLKPVKDRPACEMFVYPDNIGKLDRENIDALKATMILEQHKATNHLSTT